MTNALISIGIFLVLQLVAAIWWAATMTAKMDYVITGSMNTKANLDAHIQHDLMTFSTKSEVTQALIAHEKEVATALSFANKELAAIWKQIDIIKVK